MAFYRVTRGYLVRFPSLADFEVSADGLELVIYPAPGVSRTTIDHLYLNQSLPLALSLQKKLVLHGSAVEIDGVAVAFIGAAGRGKSTLAASFAINGMPFLTDDSLTIRDVDGACLIKPSHPSLRLWEDSVTALARSGFQTTPPIGYSSKSRILADPQFQYCDAERPFGHGYFLGEGMAPTVDITPLGGQQCVIEMIQHCHLLGADQHDLLTHNLRQLASVARQVRFFRLDYPRDYDSLARVREAVCVHLRSEASET